MARQPDSSSAASKAETHLYMPKAIPTLSDAELVQLLARSKEVTTGRLAAKNPRKARGSIDITLRVLYEQQRRGLLVRTQITEANKEAHAIAAQIHG